MHTFRSRMSFDYHKMNSSLHLILSTLGLIQKAVSPGKWERNKQKGKKYCAAVFKLLHKVCVVSDVSNRFLQVGLALLHACLHGGSGSSAQVELRQDWDRIIRAGRD